jgi:hypothetical protein
LEGLCSCKREISKMNDTFRLKTIKIKRTKIVTTFINFT